MRAGLGPLVGMALSVACVLSPARAFAGTFLFVSDSNTDNNIPAALTADGHTVTTVINDYVAATATNPTLVGPLAAYDAVFWSATGTGNGDLHAAATFTALSAYVSAGGNVFVTGYDSIASPADTNLIAFLGGTGSADISVAPGPVVVTSNALNTGVVDIRGVTPTGANGDLDALTGFGADVTVVVTTTGVPTEAQWLLRTVGAGLIAYVSQGQNGPTSALASWTTTTAGGAGAYNAALRNFAANTSTARVLFVSDANTDNNIPAALRADVGVRVVAVINDYVAATEANPTLEGALGRYDAIVWSASGNTGAGAVHRAATFTALTNYVNAGGYVLVTGVDALASPADPELIAFLGGTGATDRFGAASAPSALTAASTPLTVGRVDVRGLTPSGGGTDYDALTGFGVGVVVVAVTATTFTEAQWTVRTLGSGRIAFVSNGDSSFAATTAHPSWTNTAAGGAGVYNAAVRNFAFAARAAGGPTPIAPGAVCTTSTLCGVGACADGVCCNSACGGGVATDCQACSVRSGAAVNGVCGAVAAATTCRAAGAGGCDVAEVCNGVALTCPADAFAAVGTTCRATAGICDLAETCTGTATCPANTFASAGTSCRATAGICDTAETCTGAAAACPTDAFAAAGTSCRGSAGICDVAEACSGSAAACPTDAFVTAGTACRASMGDCDMVEACLGGAAACPIDGFAAIGTGCRAAAGACDVAEVCAGAVACPADVFAAAGTECRAAAGTCDVAESCGGAAACPANGFALDGTACGDSMTCNGAEVCAAGSCAAGTTPDCDDADACTADSCAEPSGCAHDAIAACCNVDTDCDDGDDCTEDLCDGGNVCAFDPIVGCGVDGGTELDGGTTDFDGGMTLPDAGPADGGDTDGGNVDGGNGDGSVDVDAGRIAPPRDDGGCGCTVPGNDGTSTGGAGGLLAFGVLAIVIARRRRR